MARPLKCRSVSREPDCVYFKPRGIPLSELEEIVLTVDEVEALRLADVVQLYHAEAAAKMGISRATFGNIVAAARKKVGEALIDGKALRIGGGTFRVKDPCGLEGRGCCCRRTGEAEEGEGRCRSGPCARNCRSHRGKPAVRRTKRKKAGGRRKE